MASSIDANLADWSATEASNSPAGTDTADLDADLRRLQAAVRKYMRSPATPLASATTVDLATADGDYVSVTGTTTITGLGTVSAGMRFILVFSGALTFTHNATSLILPGGANITTAAGDVVWMESLGAGNWKCLAYMPAAGYQGKDAELTALAGLTSAADKVPYFTGLGTADVATLTSFARTVLDDADAATARTTLGIVSASTSAAGIVELATAAETQAQSSTTLAVTPNALDSILVSAWVSFDGTTNTAGLCTIRGSHNVTSVTDNGTGDYTITFTTALGDDNYAISGWAWDYGVIVGGDGTNAPASTTCRVRLRGHEGSAVDSSHVTLMFIR